MAKLQLFIANAEVTCEQKVQLLIAYAPQVLLASGENCKPSSVDRILAMASAAVLSQAGAVSQTEDGDDNQYVYTHFFDGSVSGEYILAGAYKDKDVAAPPNGWPVVLVYHGGSRNAEEILEHSKLGHLAAVVISLQGHRSCNGYSLRFERRCIPNTAFLTGSESPDDS